MRTRRLLAAAALVALVGTTACDWDRPPITTNNLGPRGISMGTVLNPRDSVARLEAIQAAMPELPPPISGQLAENVAAPGTFQNVQVLGNLSVAEFNRTMVAMTQWVAPEQGCNYCHYVNPQGEVNMASDSVYTKVVSRRMLQMVKYINSEWSSHVGDAGVNCYTCHQGQPQPVNTWTLDPQDPNLRYYLDREDVRVQSDVALTSDATTETSIQNARNTYWLMIHTTNALGVNCTFCHASARFADWEESPPARVKALRGYRMVRGVNQQFVAPLGPILPDSIQGPEGDGPKVRCLTCHNGISIPQYGLSRATDFPGLTLPEAVHPTAATEAAGPFHGSASEYAHPDLVGGGE